MSLGILTLKIGLVAGVTGVSIATPILLKNKVSSVTENSQSLQVTDSQQVEAGREGSRDSDSQRTLSEAERAGSPVVSSDLSHSGSSMSSPTPVIKKEEFDKKCFVVPAESNGGNDIKLLTCYDPKKFINKEFTEEQPEYDSIFHILDTSKTDNPVKINEKLEWNPESRHLVAKLESNSESEYIFTAAGNEWKGISDNQVINLLDEHECAIYEVTRDSLNPQKTHLLACGKYVGEFSNEEPKGIHLTNWERERQLS
ncbi:hypothetical protein WEN_02160 [Mycoplasma wenyonii str. Massachusetts]|uniref:Uncharacterized protein n=1 Tax=Mycoplasma wenyonii (strain Massachusetts) TaxID=1197325 RepID=I6YB72_MYCWM|nr:hypothetical protein [Mycoplasma wenyonii]AFN65221.1 hypothetical protein WEN_02160 [Mycoplasma wenyonii str. Massachusetts]